MIDPLGWAEIDGEAFAPGFFIWNSEVGRRTLGIQTFWFQRVCQNHLVWDAVEVVEFTRKHTANVREGLTEIRRIIEGLVASWHRSIAGAAIRFPLTSERLSMPSKPIHEVQRGLIRARIWRKKTRSGIRHTVALTRLFRNGETWKESTRFGRDDLPVLRLVLHEAHSWIYLNANDTDC